MLDLSKIKDEDGRKYLVALHTLIFMAVIGKKNLTKNDLDQLINTLGIAVLTIVHHVSGLSMKEVDYLMLETLSFDEQMTQISSKEEPFKEMRNWPDLCYNVNVFVVATQELMYLRVTEQATPEMAFNLMANFSRMIGFTPDEYTDLLIETKDFAVATLNSATAMYANLN